MVVFIIISFFGIVIIAAIKKSQDLKRIKAQYDDALLKSNKREALRLGRLYYSSLRGKGKLTIYDEQAITNDISTMKGE